MIKKLSMAIFCATTWFSSITFATTNHTFIQGLGIEYELPINDPQVFSNIFFWSISATCTIMSEDTVTPLGIKMLRKKGSVNYVELTAGDSIELMVQNGERLNITAESGSKVELINHGERPIRASCST